jgi:hypothetical protein
MPFVTEFREANQYTGTNGQDLVNWLDGTYTVFSDTGSVLVLRDSEGTRKTIQLNGWLVRDGGGTLVWHGSAVQYAAGWVALS